MKLIRKLSGDILQIASNATRVIAKWGDVLQKIKGESSVPTVMRCHNSQGEVLIDQELPPDYGGFPNVYVNRGRTQRLMYDYAVSLGIEFNFGKRVGEYIEEHDRAGIQIEGEKHYATVVVVADGIHSKARAYITGKATKPVSSGFAVYRSWFSLDALRDEPLLDGITKSKEDLFLVWIGPDTHAIVLTNPKLNHLVCFCTHKVSRQGFGSSKRQAIPALHKIITERK